MKISFMHVLYSEMKLYSRSRYRVTNTSRYSSWVFSETPAQDLVALIFSSNTWSEKTNERGRAASSAFRSSHVSEEGSRKRRTRSWHTHQDGAQVRHVAEEAEDVHGGRIRAQTTRCEFRSGWSTRRPGRAETSRARAREAVCEEREERDPLAQKLPAPRDTRRISHLETARRALSAVRVESRTLENPPIDFIRFFRLLALCRAVAQRGVRRSREPRFLALPLLRVGRASTPRGEVEISATSSP
jgi:hypothetical protein